MESRMLADITFASVWLFSFFLESSQLIRNYSGFLRCVHFDNVHNFNTDTGEVMRIHICKRTGITWSKVSLGFVV